MSAFWPDGGPGVLFETGPDGRPAAFRAPRALIVAERRGDVPAALARLDAAQRDGFWTAGLLGYELGYALDPAYADLDLPDAAGPLLVMGVFDAPRCGAEALDRADAMAGGAEILEVRPRWDAARHQAAFEAVAAMIGRGDLYQVNLTFRADLDYRGTPQALWGALRRRQPVPHGAVMDLAGTQVLSRSPELFFRAECSGRVTVAPMKGTAPRSADAATDRRLRETLAADEKNRAENIMIVDLMRNDLSRVAEFGTVRVPELMRVLSYETVHQMVSRVEARLRPGIVPSDILAALFPCGSVTGAPKIAAMRAIHALEGAARGAYCGSLGWIAPDGRAEFNVAIRTLTLAGPGRAVLGIGGGVVADSTAPGEYEEALWKARFVTDLIPSYA
ncbi:aminodeoxychorismate synthase component I [Roseivivax sp. CAU 1761]